MNNFSITLCSDLDYEGMVVDIKYGKTRIALAHYDKGIDAIEIIWFSNNISENKQSYPLSDLVETLNNAYNMLRKCALEDQSR
ncbi:MAG: hypothetical protein H7A38_02445 [Chlamydiales bacterium]|nr:hypothetical protein [Chlamydiales bacterium]